MNKHIIAATFFCALLTACGGGSDTLGPPVGGNQRISIQNVIIDTNNITFPIGNTDVPYIDRNISNNFQIKWDSTFATYYAKINIGISTNFDSTANHMIFDGICDTSLANNTICHAPSGGGTVTLSCSFDNSSNMGCSNNTAVGIGGLTVNTPVYINIKLCGDTTDFTCTTPVTKTVVLQ